MNVLDMVKRLLVGRKLANAQLGETLLPKRIALPVFASDALSSVAYAPDEILLTLSLAGLAGFAFSWQIALAVAGVMLIVVLSYRQTVHAYPSGGGDYEVATVNLGPNAGLVVASALLVDYILTVAVSVSSGVQNAKAIFPALQGHEGWVAALGILVLMAMNLRGVRESGSFFAIPTYGFMIGVLGMTGWGLFRIFGLGEHLQAPTAGLEVIGSPAFEPLAGVAMVVLLARAFSSGCAALTGVEAISNGVPAFREPKSRNAATTLALLGGVAITMLSGIIVLANLTGLKLVDPDGQSHFAKNGVPIEVTHETAMGQLARTIFDNFQPGFYFVIAMTMIILILAANTAFNGFPVLGSILARDGFLPKALHTRGDRLAYSNGIIALAAAAIALVLIYNASVTSLIQLYVVGVFVSFTVSQFGMMRHWTRHLSTERDPKARARMQRSRVINAIGLTGTGVVLVIVLASKFIYGAYLAVLAMAAVFVLMRSIRNHYQKVSRETAVSPTEARLLPSRVRAVIMVQEVNKPTMRAVNFARATRASSIEAVTVSIDEAETREIIAEWEAQGLEIPLRVIASPYREVTGPFLNYVKGIRSDNPRDVVCVYIPEYVVGHWWESLLHNQTGLILKARLNFMQGVMVTSVPYQLASSKYAIKRAKRDNVAAWRRPGSGQVRTSDADDRPAEVSPLQPGEVVAGLEIGPVAHGGHFVARHEGQVIFVRHALSGEVVDVEITDVNRRYARGSVVAVQRASEHRVTPPCPVAGRCGGCDFQHVSAAHSRELKRQVVAEQLAHLAGYEFTGAVAEVLPSPLHWRSRMRYRLDDQGRPGLLAHRSREIVLLPEGGCRIALPQIADPPAFATEPMGESLLAIATEDGLFIDTDDATEVTERVGDRSYQVAGDGFWQPHTAAAVTLSEAVTAALAPQPGEVAFDLYCGVGLFAGALAATGCAVWGRGLDEGGRAARRNVPTARFLAGDVARRLARLPGRADLVVLDPPRTGAGADVLAQLVRRSPRRIAYVACDPAALGRDLRTLDQLGYLPSAVSAYDLFPLTHHVECLAILEPR